MIMNVKERRKLIEQQNKLMQEREELERMQTDYSYNDDIYKFCLNKMNLLNEAAERIRYVLEMGCCDE